MFKTEEKNGLLEAYTLLEPAALDKMFPPVHCDQVQPKYKVITFV